MYLIIFTHLLRMAITIVILIITIPLSAPVQLQSIDEFAQHDFAWGYPFPFVEQNIQSLFDPPEWAFPLSYDLCKPSKCRTQLRIAPFITSFLLVYGSLLLIEGGIRLAFSVRGGSKQITSM